MKEYCHTFMEDYSKQRNKPSTQRGYQGVIDRCIIPIMGRMKVQDVKRPDVAALMKKLAYKQAEANRTFGVLRKMFNLAEVWGLRPDGTNPCRHVPMYPPGKETRLIVDDELVRIFRQLEKLEAEGLENYVIPLAIRLQFEFAARRSEICPLEWAWVDLEKRRVVWPDSKTGGISKPMSEEAYRLLSTAPGRLPLCPTVAERPDPAPDPRRALRRLDARAQGGRRAACRYTRHPPPGDDRHCQLGCSDQGGHEAHRSQDRGDVHALCSYRGQAGAGRGRTGGESAAGDYRGIPFYGGDSMTRKTPVATRKPAALPAGYAGIHGGIVELLDAARQAAARSVNAMMTASYWEIGRRIVEAEQKGRRRAGYGEQLMERLSADLTARFGRGFGVNNLESMRRFYDLASFRRTAVYAVMRSDSAATGIW